MIEILTVINTVAIIAYFILQIVIFKSGKPKMKHLTDWMEKQEEINKQLISRQDKQAGLILKHEVSIKFINELVSSIVKDADEEEEG